MITILNGSYLCYQTAYYMLSVYIVVVHVIKIVLVGVNVVDLKCK